MKQTEINTNSSAFESFEENESKWTWKPAYTWVLLANAGYILIFYILMKIFS